MLQQGMCPGSWPACHRRWACVEGGTVQLLDAAAQAIPLRCNMQCCASVQALLEAC